MTLVKLNPLLILTFVFTVLVIFASPSGRLTEVKDLIPPPPQIEKYSLGIKYQLADLFWIRALQDFDYCEKKLKQNLCQGNSWLSKVLLSIVRLDPDYHIAYTYGALALTILVSDYPGASQLFDLGVQRYPKDWWLNYSAAYHASFEEKNYTKAAALYKQAAENGAPPWTYALAARLYTKEGQVEMSQKLIDELEKKGGNETLIERIKERIKEAKAEK